MIPAAGDIHGHFPLDGAVSVPLVSVIECTLTMRLRINRFYNGP